MIFTFQFPVGCEKVTIHVQFDSDVPIMAYHQHDQNSCCFSILSSALKASNQVSAANLIATRISYSITYEILDRLMFANDILTDTRIRKGGQHLCYKLELCNKIGNFDFLNNISKYLTLFQLMDSVGNVNHAVSVVVKWMFDSN